MKIVLLHYKRSIVLLSIIICIGLTVGVLVFPIHKPNEYHSQPNDPILLHFITRNMMSPAGGIYTNLHSKEQLSESTGLLMQYAVHAQNKYLYINQKSFLLRHLLTKYNILKWRVNNDKHSVTSTNASIDDLRIINSLLMGYSKWHQQDDLQLAIQLANGLIKWNTANNTLYDFYNWSSKQRSQKTTISYLDVATMKQLSQYDPNWKLIYENSVHILVNSELKDGFFYTYYEQKNNHYVKHVTFNMIDTLLPAIHLAQVGIQTPKTKQFIETKWKQDHKIYNDYDINGKPVSFDESPAVYALMMRYLVLCHEPKILLEDISRHMMQLSIMDKKSIYYGGFVELKHKQAFSFNQLQVLLLESELN